MDRFASLSIVALGLAACPTQARIYNAGSSAPPSPDGLAALAAEVRATGGYVLMGTILSTTEGEPERIADVPVPGLHLAYPIVVAEVTVVDPLGDSMPRSITVRSGDGLPEIVRPDGTPDPGWLVSGTTAYMEHRWLPTTGTRLIFVLPGESHPFVLVWTTTVADGWADGDGTRDDADVPLTSLAR